MERYFIDTCILRDFYENRFGRKKEPIGDYAAKFFLYVFSNKNKLFISQISIKELKTDFSECQINDLIYLLGKFISLDILKPEHYEIKEADNLSKERNIPFADCLIAVQTRNKKSVAITRDRHFFNNLTDVCDSLKPENF
ncbi:type II toxin-antitoxin system VapC family toxin [Candidatus Woesearchaeota archaeon]|nr:type II toxin-antitoxin system VapC family toxin [Candidatus Woesearchaeota archaeon]